MASAGLARSPFRRSTHALKLNYTRAADRYRFQGGFSGKYDSNASIKPA